MQVGQDSGKTDGLRSWIELTGKTVGCEKKLEAVYNPQKNKPFFAQSNQNFPARPKESKISQVQVRAGKALFKQLDSNGSQQLSRAEMERAYTADSRLQPMLDAGSLGYKTDMCTLGFTSIGQWLVLMRRIKGVLKTEGLQEWMISVESHLRGNSDTAGPVHSILYPKPDPKQDAQELSRKLEERLRKSPLGLPSQAATLEALRNVVTSSSEPARAQLSKGQRVSCQAVFDSGGTVEQLMQLLGESPVSTTEKIFLELQELETGKKPKEGLWMDIMRTAKARDQAQFCSKLQAAVNQLQQQQKRKSNTSKMKVPTKTELLGGVSARAHEMFVSMKALEKDNIYKFLHPAGQPVKKRPFFAPSPTFTNPAADLVKDKWITCNGQAFLETPKSPPSTLPPISRAGTPASVTESPDNTQVVDFSSMSPLLCDTLEVGEYRPSSQNTDKRSNLSVISQKSTKRKVTQHPKPEAKFGTGIRASPSFSGLKSMDEKEFVNPEVTRHRVGPCLDTVYVQPYLARLTDVDLGESGVFVGPKPLAKKRVHRHQRKVGNAPFLPRSADRGADMLRSMGTIANGGCRSPEPVPEINLPRESNWTDKTRPGVQLRVSHHCGNCMLSELRHIHVVDPNDAHGLTHFSRAPQQLIVDDKLEQHRLAQYEKVRKEELQQWASVLIQAGYRGRRARRLTESLRSQWAEATKIQKIARAKLAREEVSRKKFKMVLATLQIQRCLRGMMGRTKFVNTYEAHAAAALHIQRAARGRADRKASSAKLEAYTEAALRIQAARVGLHSRRATTMKRNFLNKQTLRIQRIFRGKKGRAFASVYRYWRSAAAVKLQGAWRIRYGKILRRRHYLAKCHLAATAGRVFRGFKGRKIARKALDQKKKKMAIIINKSVRMMLGARKWSRCFQAHHATRIQCQFRSKKARSVVQVRRTDRFFMMIRIQQRAIRFRKWVAKRSAASLVCQRVLRGLAGRRHFLWFKRDKAAKALQRFVRNWWVLRALRLTTWKTVRIYRFWHKIAMPNYAVHKHYRSKLEQGRELRTNQMHELYRILEVDPEKVEELFPNARELDASQWNQYGKVLTPDANGEPVWDTSNCVAWVKGMDNLPQRWVVHAWKQETCQVLLEYKKALRSIYLKAAGIMVTVAEKAFKLQKEQWLKFLKDSKLLEGMNKADAEKIFVASKEKLKKDIVVPVKTKKSKAANALDRGKKKAGNTSDAEDLQLDEFVETLIRFALVKVDDTGGIDEHGITITLSTAQRLRKLFEQNLMPYLADTDYEDVGTDGRDSPEVVELLQTVHARMKKFYRRYGGVSKGGESTIDVIEFMLAIKDAKLFDTQLSFSKALEIFLRANQEEVEEYFNAMPDYKEITDMSLEFDEFVEVVVGMANVQKKKKPDEPLHIRLATFIERMLTNTRM